MLLITLPAAFNRRMGYHVACLPAPHPAHPPRKSHRKRAPNFLVSIYRGCQKNVSVFKHFFCNHKCRHAVIGILID